MGIIFFVNKLKSIVMAGSFHILRIKLAYLLNFDLRTDVLTFDSKIAFVILA